MDERVSVTISEGVADVRLVRADKMNALDAAMFEALVATSARLAQRKRPAGGSIVRRGPCVLRRPRHGPFCRDEGEGRQRDSRRRKARPFSAHPRPRQFSATGGVGLAAAAGAGDCRDPGRGVRRRLSARARRRHALPRAGRADVDHGNQMGAGARHGGDADPGQPGARRYPARTDLYRADFLGAGGPELRPRHADLRRPARRAPSRSRARSPARARKRSAPPSACSTICRSIPARRCWPNPSSR